MHNTIISDTSCIIVLSNIDELSLLRSLYDRVTTTSMVAMEYGEELPGWFDIRDPASNEQLAKLEYQLDPGEASAIALALEMVNPTIIIDDYKARQIASELGLEVTGTLGVIVKAKLAGIIPSIKPILAKLKATNFRLTLDLEQSALTKAGEPDVALGR